MRTMVTGTCMILILCSGGLAVSQALSWERWVNLSRVAAQPALAQERRPATSPVAGSRFARPVPRGWTAPSLVGARGRPEEPWRSRLAQLGLPVAAQSPRLGVEPAGVMGLSMGRDAGAPLPQVRLVKDVLDAMPNKCDERLFSTWYCGVYCAWSCEARYGVMTIKRSLDPDGYERIHQRWDDRGYTWLSEWRVERKWVRPPSFVNSPVEKGKLTAASCNTKTPWGSSILSVNLKSPDGSERLLYKYQVDGENRTMRLSIYTISWKGDTPHSKPYGGYLCQRELAE